MTETYVAARRMLDVQAVAAVAPAVAIASRKRRHEVSLEALKEDG